MKKIVFEDCPYCGSNMLVYGYQSEAGAIFSDVRGGVFGTPVEHIICQECGSIIYSRVIRPDIFKEYLNPKHKEEKEKNEKQTPKPKKDGVLEIIVDDETPYYKK